MEMIELWNANTKAIISPEGAWLTNLSDDNGDILYPKRKLKASDGSQKTRGGVHVCLPNFGPGGVTELAQHGFGRTALWEVSSQTPDSVNFYLSGGAEGYEGLASTLTYALGATSLTMDLQLSNEGAVPLRVGPAFHPYFALQAGEGQVKLDDEMIDLQDLGEMQLREGVSKELQTTRRTIQIGSTGLHTWALWTDQIGTYVCVEPTFGGYTFLDAEPRAGELLQPDETRSYDCTISW